MQLLFGYILKAYVIIILNNSKYFDLWNKKDIIQKILL